MTGILTAIVNAITDGKAAEVLRETIKLRDAQIEELQKKLDEAMQASAMLNRDLELLNSERQNLREENNRLKSLLEQKPITTTGWCVLERLFEWDGHFVNADTFHLNLGLSKGELNYHLDQLERIKLVRRKQELLSEAMGTYTPPSVEITASGRAEWIQRRDSSILA